MLESDRDRPGTEPLPPHDSSICIDCGLCCDGSLFATVPVTDKDAPGELEAAGFTITLGDDGKKMFRQPCTAFQSGCCAVYAQRPSACRHFRCALLRNQESGAITVERAREVIRQATAARDRVQTGLLALGLELGAPATSALLPRLAAMPAEERRKHAHLLLDVGVLRMLLATHFETDSSRAKPQ